MAIEVSPDPLTAGGTASIRIENVGAASITVTINNGQDGDRYREETVQLSADDTGTAEGTWEVPNDPLWTDAVFDAPGQPTTSVLIQPV